MKKKFITNHLHPNYSQYNVKQSNSNSQRLAYVDNIIITHMNANPLNGIECTKVISVPETKSGFVYHLDDMWTLNNDI